MKSIVSKNAIACEIEEMANAVMTKIKKVPEGNPHEERYYDSGHGYYKDMVLEMPLRRMRRCFFCLILWQNLPLIKNDKDLFMPVERQKKVRRGQKVINENFPRKNLKSWFE